MLAAVHVLAGAEYSSDDGEAGGSIHILREMQYSGITNRLVVVSRWWSGVELGKKRFSIITQCTKAVIQISHHTDTIPKTTGPRQTTVVKNSPQTNPVPGATYNFSSPIQLSYPSGSTQYQPQGHNQSVPYERTDTVPSPGAPYSIQTHSSVFAGYHGSPPPTTYNGAFTVPHNYGGNSDAIVSMETITGHP